MTTTVLAALLTLAVQDVALPREVAYLPQTEALCGGAASAMVMRYWGDTSIRPADFAPLVDARQSGIVTTALVDNLRERGWQPFPLRGGKGDAAAIAQHLSRGRPIIALIEDRPSRYHYVVITALTGDAVRFHDPAVAPNRSMPRAEFDRRWSAANFWMLLLLPGTEAGPAIAESGSPLAADVARLLSAGKTADALQISEAATRTNPRDVVAWDAMGTTLFVMDQDLDALDAWNRAGKPIVDTVQISGLTSTRFRAAERLIGYEPGDLVTRGGLARARRRLALLPSAAGSRVSYAPMADGRVQIDAALVERSRLPGVFDLATAAAKAPFTRDVGVGFTNLVGAGERVTASWRWREGFERVEAAIEVPAPLPLGAVWKLNGLDARETFQRGPIARTLRWRQAGFQASDWVTSWLGWTLGGAFERWPDTAQRPPGNKAHVAGRALVAAGDHFDGHVTLEGWLGDPGATRAGAEGRLRGGGLGGRALLVGGMQGVHGYTPGFILPGAGDGNTRRPLLRAHPLIQGDAISVSNGRIFARRLFYGTAEWSHPIARVLFASIDGAVFVDGAHGRQLIDDRARATQFDAGAGLRIRAAGGPTFRLDIARGLRDKEWAITAGTVVGFERWIF
ncbi:MAG: C39 family peptidase [Acidobacteriota bacterium]|nr:C39 family peptidase [Acidobacteriota bacterium]